MTMPETGFPQFPTLYQEEDAKRLQELEKQRSILEEAYQKKFTPTAWARVSTPEKMLRELLPSWLAPVIRALPGEQPTWGYAFTPEQALDMRLKVEGEYKELVRKEKVTRLLPQIQADMMLLALSGEPITDISDLLSNFPELRTDFTEEERSYLSAFAQNLIHANPEDILSGKVFGYDPSKLPITPKDLEDFAKTSKGAGIDARFISASVAFSRDKEQLAEALKQAYPAKAEDVVPTTPEGLRERLLDYFQERVGAQGIRTAEGEPLKSTVQRSHGAIAGTEGQLLTLTNESTGEIVSARLNQDNTVDIDGNFIGYYVADINKIVPMTLKGQPMVTEQEQESMFKDWWDLAYLSLADVYKIGRQFFSNSIPRYFTTHAGMGVLEIEDKFPDQAAAMRAKSPEEYNKQRQLELQTEEEFKLDYERREARHQEWLVNTIKEHPELTPRPEWDEPMVDRFKRSPKELLDVGYLGAIISRNINTFLAVGATLGATALTRNPYAGMAVGSTLFTPMEAESLRSDLIENGATYSQASDISLPAGMFISSLESIGNFPIIKAIAPQFFKSFKSNIQKELTRSLAKKALRAGIITPAKIIVSETIEEDLQEIAHNAFVKTVNEKRGLFENVPETTLQSIVLTAPLGFFGGGAEWVQIKRNLPKDVQDKLDQYTVKLEESGVPKEQAELVAYNKVTETDVGQAAVELAIEKAETEVGHSFPPIFLESTENDIKNMDEKLGKQKEAVEKAREDFKKSIPKSALISIPVSGSEELEELVDLDVVTPEMLEKVKTLKGELEQYIRLKDAREGINSFLAQLKKADIVPTGEQKSAKLQALEQKLSGVNKDSDDYSAKLMEQQDVLANMKKKASPSDVIASQEELVGMVQEQVAALEARKSTLIKQMRKIREIPPIEAVIPEVTPEVTLLDLTPDVEALHAKLSAAKSRNSAVALKELEKLEAKGIDASEAKDALDNYKSLERTDYDSAEDFADARTEAWDEFLEAVDIIDASEVAKPAIPKVEPSMPEVTPVIPEIPLASTVPYLSKVSPRYVQELLEHLDGISEKYKLEPDIFDKLIKFVEGYSKFAVEGNAFTDEEVGNLFGLIAEDLKFRSEEQFYYDEALTSKIKMALSTGVRFDKIDAIETFIHQQHERGSILPQVLIPYRGSEKLLIPIERDGVFGFSEDYLKISALVNNILDDLASGTPTAPVIEEKIPLPLMAEESVLPESIAARYWDILTPEEQAVVAEDMGLAKTVVGRKFSELTDVQQQRVMGVPYKAEQVMTPEPSQPIGRVPTGRGIFPHPFDREPKLPPLEDELKAFNAGLDAHPEIAAAMRLNPDFLEASTRIETFYKNLHQELADLTAKQERGEDVSAQMKETKKKFRKVAEESGLDSKSLMTTGWDNLTPTDRRAMILAGIIDFSIPFKIQWRGMDSRFVFQDFQRETGRPFYTIYKRTRIAKGYIDRLVDEYMDRLEKHPRFSKVRGDLNAERRMAQELNARDPDSGVQHPEDLTDDERLIVDEIASIYDEWKPVVRWMRFIEAYEDSAEIKDIMKAIPDAPQLELELAKGLLETQGENALWNFLVDETWGVRESGYDPRVISQPTLKTKLPPLATVRGRGRLMQRESLAFPAGMEMGLFNRLRAYSQSMSVRAFLRSEINSLEDELNKTWDKWGTREEVRDYIRDYIRELQGFPQRGSIIDWTIRRLYSIAAPVIFWNPWLCFRNVIQPLWGFPFRTRLFTAAVGFRQLPEDLKRESVIYFDAVVDQSGREIKEWMFQGQDNAFPGRLNQTLKNVLTPVALGIKPFEALSRLAARTSMFSKTDYISRSWAYDAALVKAWEATGRYLKDGNIKKWIASSGAYYLREEQINHILGLLAQDKITWNIPGVDEVTGAHAASITIAEEVANTSLYMYDRSARGQESWGASGRTLASLIVFPKSTFQATALQGAKIFNKDLPASERIAGARNILLLIATGHVLSMMLTAISGRERREYNLVDMFTWQVGGLTVGLAQDVFGTVSNLVIAAGGSEEMKERAKNELPSNISRLGDTFVFLYKQTFDAIEAVTDTTGLDKQFMRELRALVEKDYKPEDLEKIDRDGWEMFQKVLAGTDPPDPTVYEKALVDLDDMRKKIGAMDAEGRFYTLSKFAGDVRTLTKGLPDDMVSEEYGFSDLVVFYKRSEDSWQELYTLSSTPAKVRQDWRKTHVEAEARLLFWGMYSQSVFEKGSKEWYIVSRLLQSYFSQFGIDRSMHEKWADWTSPPSSTGDLTK